MPKVNPLIGKKIQFVLLAEDKSAIRFVLTDGTTVTAIAFGDCCSQTWIDSVLGSSNLLDSEVLSVEEKTTGEAEESGDELTQYYAC